MSSQAPISKSFDLQRLRVFVEVARQGSVVGAAEALHLSQPTVSLHLKALNEMLGLPVVERRGRGIALTEAGEALAGHARTILAEVARAQEAIDARRGVTAGALRVGAGTTPGTYVLPGLLGEFHHRHPGVELHLEVSSSASIAVMVESGELHLGIVGELAPGRQLEQRPLLSDSLVCAVPPDNPATRAGVITRDQLRESVLLARRSGSSTQAIADAHLNRHRIAVARRWELDSPEAIKQAVRGGLGIAFLSELTIDDELDAGHLATVEVENAPHPERTLDLIRSAGHPLSPAEQAFVDLIAERVAAPVHP